MSDNDISSYMRKLTDNEFYCEYGTPVGVDRIEVLKAKLVAEQGKLRAARALLKSHCQCSLLYRSGGAPPCVYCSVAKQLDDK